MYFNVDFNVFFKNKKVHLLVSEFYMTKVGLSSTGAPNYARLDGRHFLSKLAYVFFTLSPLFT